MDDKARQALLLAMAPLTAKRVTLAEAQELHMNLMSRLKEAFHREFQLGNAHAGCVASLAVEITHLRAHIPSLAVGNFFRIDGKMYEVVPDAK